MKNILRTPWEIEPADRWPTLFSVYDCDGNVVAAAKIEEVARLIAGAPATKAGYDQLVRALRYIQERGLRLIETHDANFTGSLEDDGIIEDELGQDDFPNETLAEKWLEKARDDTDQYPKEKVV